METISKFQQRDPLTQRLPRTMEQADANGMAWWASAEAEAANEQHIRAMFAEPSRRARTPACDWALYLVAAIVALMFAIGVFG